MKLQKFSTSTTLKALAFYPKDLHKNVGNISNCCARVKKCQRLLNFYHKDVFTVYMTMVEQMKIQLKTVFTSDTIRT